MNITNLGNDSVILTYSKDGSPVERSFRLQPTVGVMANLVELIAGEWIPARQNLSEKGPVIEVARTYSKGWSVSAVNLVIRHANRMLKADPTIEGHHVKPSMVKQA